jgi:hypothetical protein
MEEASPLLQLPMLAFALGLALSVPYTVTLFRASLQYSLFAQQVVKLLMADNLERALKLSHAIDVPLTIATREALELARGGVGDLVATQGDYRSASADFSEPTVTAVLRARYEQSLRRSTASWNVWRALAALGCLSFLGGLIPLRLGLSAAPPSTALCALGALALAGLVRKDLGHHRGVREAFDTMAPALFTRAVQAQQPR